MYALVPTPSGDNLNTDLWLGGEAPGLADLVLAGVQVQPLVLQDLKQLSYCGSIDRDIDIEKA